MPGILDLPAELIPSILSHLDNNDYFTARLTCKHIESSTLSSFGQRYFRKKGYLITSPSLNVLKSIAAHSELHRYVQHVWFNPDLFTFIMPECARDPHWPYAMIYNQRSERDQLRYEIYQDCIHDHKNLLMSENLKDILTTAFSTLPNLEAVGMRRSEDHQPWGWGRLKAAVGEDPRVLGVIPSGPISSLSGPTYLFMAIVEALSTTGVKIKRLYTDAIETDNILPTILTQEKYNTAFSSLLYLEINASKAWLTQRAKSSRSLDDESQFGSGLLSLLKATPQLREIGLQIFRDLRQRYLVPPASRNPESWKQSYPCLAFQNLTQGVHLQHLTRIKLEKLITTAETLRAFMEPSKRNLQSIKMRDVRLVSSDEEKMPWRTIFSFLQNACDRLSYLLLYHLMYEHGGVSFLERPPGLVPYNETDDMNGAPNPPFGPYGEPAGGELFTKYDHIAVEAVGREHVVARLDVIVDGHWYQQPIFSYAMDESLWHTDTSDEEMESSMNV